MRPLLTSLIIFLITSCASISEKTCRAGQWKELGLKDGQAGKTLEQLIEYQNECGEYGIQPNKYDYTTGLKEGYLLYCENKGLDLGRKGDNRTIPILCRKVSTFLPARRKGVQEYCFGKGVEIGKLGVNQFPPRVCKGKIEYDQGIQQGLQSYCSFENGRALGKVAARAKVKVCPRDLKISFENGLQQGTKEYCSRKNGFEMGQLGSDMKLHVCPQELKGEFETAYRKGEQYLQLKRKADTLKVEMKDINDKLQSTDLPRSTRDYLKTELIRKEVLLKETQKNIYRIEGFIGV